MGCLVTSSIEYIVDHLYNQLLKNVQKVYIYMQ